MHLGYKIKSQNVCLSVVNCLKLHLAIVQQQQQKVTIKLLPVTSLGVAPTPWGASDLAAAISCWRASVQSSNKQADLHISEYA